MKIHFNEEDKQHIAKYKGDLSPVGYILKLLEEDKQAKQGAKDGNERK